MSKKSRNWLDHCCNLGGGGRSVVLVVANIRSQTSAHLPTKQWAVQTGTLTSTVEGTGVWHLPCQTSLTWKASGQVAQVNAQIGEQVNPMLFWQAWPPDLQTRTTLETNLVTAQENWPS